MTFASYQLTISHLRSSFSNDLLVLISRRVPKQLGKGEGLWPCLNQPLSSSNPASPDNKRSIRTLVPLIQ